MRRSSAVLTRCLLDAFGTVGAPFPCYTKSDMLYSSPFLPARFPSEDHMRRMAARAILVKGWHELWARGSTLEAALADLKEKRAAVAVDPMMDRWVNDASLVYDVRIDCFGHGLSDLESSAIRHGVREALGLKGQYKANAPRAMRFWCMIDIGSTVINPTRVVRQVFLTRELSGCANSLENDYRLNARKFIGPTSMPAGLSFIMSNLGKVSRRSIVFDPFVGTGSLIVSAGHFGALCVGADLDWKILHGRTRKGPISVFDNFKQYKLQPPEILCADLSLNGWRDTTPAAIAAATAGFNSENGGGFVDAIVCDPPYGVRAGARKLGRAEGKEKEGGGKKDNESASSSSAAPFSGAESPRAATAPAAAASAFSSAHAPEFSCPPTQNYDVEDVIHDLLDLAAQLLRVGGRLVYWLPTTTDFRNDELPCHPCLRQVSVGEQLVRSHFSRRLITMEKTLPFAESRRMRRRNKTTEPAPKYANLKESIMQAVESGPDMNTLEFASASPEAVKAAQALGYNPAAAASSPSPAAAAASSSPSSPSVDLSTGFAPRPLSNRSQKRLAKAESIRTLKAAILTEHGGTMPTRRERQAQRDRMSQQEWEAHNKEKNQQAQRERQEKKAAAAAAAAAAASPNAAATVSMEDVPIASAAASSSSAPAPAPAPAPLPPHSIQPQIVPASLLAAAAAAASSSASSSAPPSPGSSQPMKKARVDK